MDFLRHDRMTLAGVMLGCAALYLGLSLGGMRRGQLWAKEAVAASALVGFFSFFLFLGFGYFDPFHAFVTAISFSLMLQVVRGTSAGVCPDASPPEKREDQAWQLGQWGQFLFVIHGTALFIAGVVISCVGITRVFVQEDFDFLCISRERLEQLGQRLIPVVAHDRATLGGMLLACGTAQLLATLWGFGRGRMWLWNSLFWMGLPAYVCAIGIHHHVGYVDWLHLLPAWLGAALWALGLALSRKWLKG